MNNQSGTHLSRMPRRKTQQNRNYHSSHIDPIQEKECGVSPKLATPYIAGFLSQSDDPVIDEQSWQKRGKGDIVSVQASTGVEAIVGTHLLLQKHSSSR